MSKTKEFYHDEICKGFEQKEEDRVNTIAKDVWNNLPLEDRARIEVANVDYDESFENQYETTQKHIAKIFVIKGYIV